jgi:sulfite oxidase
MVLGRISIAMTGRPLAVVEVPRKDPSMVVRGTEPYNAGPPLESLRASFLTPVPLFFVRNHGTVPVADAAAYRLTVTGLVDRKLQLSLAALQREFTPSTVTATIQCAGNRRRELNTVQSIEGEIPWDAEAVGTAAWTGVPLTDVLKAAGVRAPGRHVHLLGLDRVAADAQGFGGSIPLEKAMSPEVLLAYEMNGSPLLPVHGFPLRVVVPGYIGARSVKWLRSVSVAAEPSGNYFQSRAYKLFPPHVRAQTVDWTAGLTLTEPPVNAVICTPREGQRVQTGYLSATGYAFAGGDRQIARVEMSADGGIHWETAQLVGEMHSWTWRFWEARLRLPPGRRQLIVRAEDSAGAGQPPEPASVWNFKGYVNNAWHRVTIDVD